MEEKIRKKLPKYLLKDLEMVEKYDFKTSTVYDCYLMEFYASLNMCQGEGIITMEEAKYLRDKYFFNNLEKGMDKND